MQEVSTYVLYQQGHVQGREERENLQSLVLVEALCNDYATVRYPFCLQHFAAFTNMAYLAFTGHQRIYVTTAMNGRERLLPRVERLFA